MNRESLKFNARITPVKPLNDELTLCKCYVLALGKNRNRSHLSKETVDRALPTIYNIPVIGHVYIDESGEYHMGGHDMEFKQGSDGSLELRSMCVPFGVVPYQDDIHYEEIIDSLGNKATYQVADVVLWTGRYPDLQKAIYNDSIYFGQSMEINVDDYEPLADDKSYLDITSFSYSALCLLGKSEEAEYNVEPCFPDARVEPYSFSLDETQFKELMQEFKDELTVCDSFQAMKSIKGGDQGLTIEVLDSVLAEFSLTKEELEQELGSNFENFSLEDLRAKAIEMINKRKAEIAAKKAAEEAAKEPEVQEDTSKEETTQAEEDKAAETESTTEPVVESAVETNEEATKVTDEEFASDDKQPETQETFSAIDQVMTYGQKLQALQDLANTMTRDEVNVRFYYTVNDCDNEFVYLTEEGVCEAGVTCHNYKANYTFVNGEAVLTSELVPVILKWMTEAEVESLEAQKAEYVELKQFREERLRDDRIKEYDAVVAEFSDLTGLEEFGRVIEDKMSFESADALREKCFAIRGKSMAVPTAKKPEMKVPLDYSKDSSQTEVYGGFFSKYPPRSGK